jgi:FkbH-like protein
MDNSGLLFINDDGTVEILNPTSDYSIVYNKKRKKYKSKIRVGILSDFNSEFIMSNIKFIFDKLEHDTINILTVSNNFIGFITSNEFKRKIDKIDLLFIIPEYRELMVPCEDKLKVIQSYTINLWEYIIKINPNICIIQNNVHYSFNNYEEINASLAEISSQNQYQQVVMLNINEFSESLKYQKSKLMDMARFPFPFEIIPEYRLLLLKSILRYLRMTSKIMVVDLDGTLWPGNLAEEGYESIIQDLNARNSGHSIIKFLREKFDNGTLVSICSKNYIADVELVLNNHDNYDLNRIQFHSKKISWEHKSKAIGQILDESGLLPQNLVFVDNTLSECVEVKVVYPTSIVVYLDSVNESNLPIWLSKFFNTEDSLTYEDKIRNSSNAINSKINAIKDNRDILASYLKELEIRMEVHKLSSIDYDRVEQLHARTNQFRANLSNFNKKNVDVNESEKLIIKVRDNYTDYGVVGYISLSIKDNEVVFHQWILSCRIFNRDIEFKVLNDIIERLCNNHKITNIVIEVKETGKNKYFFDFIDKINSTKRYDREKIVLNLPIKFHKNTVKSTWILN